METILGTIGLILILAFVVWRNRVDIKKNGAITREIRIRSYSFTAGWFSLLVILFLFYKPAYIGVLIVFFVYSQIFGVGSGKHGLFRQLRDSGFIACVASLPVCLVLWAKTNA